MGYKCKSTTTRGRSQDRRKKSDENHEVAYRKRKKKGEINLKKALRRVSR